jgi:hypothetical protein
MAKFKNIKKFTGEPIIPVLSEKVVSAGRAPFPKPSVPSPITSPVSVMPEAGVPVTSLGARKAPQTGPKIERRTIIEERPIQVKEVVTKRNDKQVLKSGASIKPRRMSAFLVVMVFTVFLQIVLLVSLLYLSPSLINK